MSRVMTLVSALPRLRLGLCARGARGGVRSLPLRRVSICVVRAGEVGAVLGTCSTISLRLSNQLASSVRAAFARSLSSERRAWPHCSSSRGLLVRSSLRDSCVLTVLGMWLPSRQQQQLPCAASLLSARRTKAGTTFEPVIIGVFCVSSFLSACTVLCYVERTSSRNAFPPASSLYAGFGQG